MRERIGKTEKDRRSGATARRLDNRAARVEWEHRDRGDHIPFPVLACNGKKNRSRWTGSGNKTVIIG